MSEETDEGVEIVSVAYFFMGLSVPLFFSLLTDDEVGTFLIAFGVLAACVLYGELSVSFSSGAAFGFGMLLTAFAAMNPWLVGLGISAVAANLAKNWRESSAVELEDPELGFPVGSV